MLAHVALALALASPLPAKDADNRAEIAVVNRAMDRSWNDPAWQGGNLTILHHDRCTRTNRQRFDCTYSFSFKDDDSGVVTHIESGSLAITPKRELFNASTSKRRGT